MQPTGIEPQTPGMPPPPQVVPAGQPPQSCIFPQPSPIIPQYWPVGCMQLMAVQAPLLPQTWGTPPPPQVSPAGQGAEQSSEWPQPSPMLPQ
jgi:hypothetical protein